MSIIQNDRLGLGNQQSLFNFKTKEQGGKPLAEMVLFDVGTITDSDAEKIKVWLQEQIDLINLDKDFRNKMFGRYFTTRLVRG